MSEVLVPEAKTKKKAQTPKPRRRITIFITLCPRCQQEHIVDSKPDWDEEIGLELNAPATIMLLQDKSIEEIFDFIVGVHFRYGWSADKMGARYAVLSKEE